MCLWRWAHKEEEEVGESQERQDSGIGGISRRIQSRGGTLQGRVKGSQPTW